ncbi:hypothetical protein GCM10009624_35990 [Gordonia sinesedis]
MHAQLRIVLGKTTAREVWKVGMVSDIFGSVKVDFGGINLMGGVPQEESWEEGVLWAHDDCILIKSGLMNGSWMGMRVRYSNEVPPDADMDTWNSITECGFDADVAPWLEVPVGPLAPPPLNELGIPAGPKWLRVCQRVDKDWASHHQIRPVEQSSDPASLPVQFLVEIWDATVADTGPGKIIK